MSESGNKSSHVKKLQKWLRNFRHKCALFISNNKKASIATGIIMLVIIATVITTISIVTIRKNRNLSANNETDIIVENVTIKEENETEIEEISEEETEETSEEETEETSEEETEEVEEIVEQEYVEQFFENEISTEDQEALALPSRKLSSDFIPYDGKRREISYFGDSMVAGVGNTSVNASVNGMSIYGWTSPRTIQYFTGITTYNFGVPGEDSYEISYRAGGVKLHTDRDVSISEDTPARVRLIDENGDTFTFGDYSGYGIENNEYPYSMYINNYLCSVNNAGNGEVDIRLISGYAAYSVPETDINYRVITNEDVAAIAYADVETDDINAVNVQAQETTASPVTGETQSPTDVTQPSTKESESEAVTQPVIEAPTQPAPTQPAPTQPVPTVSKVYIPAGAEAKPKVAKDHSEKDILILEIGSNGGWGSDYQTLILQYDNIILNSGCDYYIIVGDTDDPGTSIGDNNQGEYNEDGSYIGIGDTSWEAALREAYGAHFFNTRTYIIQNGLSLCGLSTTTQDLENFKRGNISKQLRYDWTHFNAYGYYVKGVGIYEKGKELGYWN